MSPPRRDPAKLPWRDLGVDVVIESTGLFTERAAAGAPRGGREEGHHLGARQGRGHHHRPGRQRRDVRRPSTTSSRTRRARRTASRPFAKVLLDNFGIEQGFMNTIHAYTNDQIILDFPHKDLRRARAAAHVDHPDVDRRREGDRPGAAGLKGKLDGMSMRVPTPDGSVVDLVAELEARGHQGRDQRRDEGRRRGPDEGHPRVQRGPDRLDRRRRQPRTRRSSTRCSDHGHGRQLREVRVVVRQRVGLLEPRRRPRREGAREPTTPEEADDRR